MVLDFTIKEFSKLCKVVTANYLTMTVAEYLTSYGQKEQKERFIIMRHDIDRKPKNALKTARIEYELGIRATYYFRSNNNVFIPATIIDIERMGHEIGYHYENLGKAKGDYEKAIELFKHELTEFRKICNIRTICMHGDPLSKYDNRDLWKVYDFKDFQILGEAYLSIGKDINYFSDTGRNWNSRNNMRDFIPGNNEKNENKTTEATEDIIDLIKSNKMDKLYILTHPERWSSNNIEWCINYMKDFTFNTGKKVLTLVGR